MTEHTDTRKLIERLRNPLSYLAEDDTPVLVDEAIVESAREAADRIEELEHQLAVCRHDPPGYKLADTIEFLRRRWVPRRCDSEAVADCERCNIVIVLNRCEEEGLQLRPAPDSVESGEQP